MNYTNYKKFLLYSLLLPPYTLLNAVSFLNDADRRMINDLPSKLGAELKGVTETAAKELRATAETAAKELRTTSNAAVNDIREATADVASALSHELRKTLKEGIPLVQEATNSIVNNAAQKSEETIKTAGEQMRTTITSFDAVAQNACNRFEKAAHTVDTLTTNTMKSAALMCAGLMGTIAGIILIKNGIDKIIESKAEEEPATTKLHKQGRYSCYMGALFSCIGAVTIIKSDSIAQLFARAR